MFVVEVVHFVPRTFTSTFLKVLMRKIVFYHLLIRYFADPIVKQHCGSLLLCFMCVFKENCVNYKRNLWDFHFAAARVSALVRWRR